MSMLSTPISMIRPPVIEFGIGTAERLGAWAGARGCRRILVVSDAFNAPRIALLGLPGKVSVFGEVRAEPDTGDLERVLAAAKRHMGDELHDKFSITLADMKPEYLA